MTGSARPLVAWVSGLLTVLCVSLAVVMMRANGVLILAVVFLIVCAWAVGVFSRSWWIADEEMSRRLDGVDQEIDFTDSVLTDLDRLTRSGV